MSAPAFVVAEKGALVSAPTGFELVEIASGKPSPYVTPGPGGQMIMFAERGSVLSAMPKGVTLVELVPGARAPRVFWSGENGHA